MKEKMMLIVDDIDANRVVLAECFDSGFTICYAGGGHEAIRLIEKYGKQLSIILLDMMMPDMDGIAVLKWLTDSPYAVIPVIAVTAEPSYQLEALEHGAWDFIAKPEDNRVIRARVNNVLGRYALEGERRHNAQVVQAKLEMDNLVNSIPGGIVTYRVTDTGFETIYFSDGIAALTGDTREEYAQRARGDVTSLIYEEDRHRVVHAAIAALKSGHVIDETYRVYHKNGSLLWVHMNAVQIGEENGMPIVHAVFQSPARMAQLYDNLVNESQSIIYVTDINNYDLLYINRTGLKAIGKEASDYSGKKCYEFLFGLSAPCTFCRVDQMCAQCFLDRDFPYSQNGRTYSMRGKLMDWNGIIAHVEYLEDVTEIRKAEQQNAALTAQMQSVMENIPGGMCVYRVDEDGIFPMVHNHAFFELLGYSDTNKTLVLEHTNYLNVHPEDVKELQEKINTAIAANARFNHTYRLFNDTKNCYVWLNINAVVVPQSDGTKLCYASYSDVTAERKTQENLLQTQRVLERMRQKAQDALDNYQLLVNTVPGGIVQYEAKDGKVLTHFFSDGICKLTGYARDERKHMSSQDVLSTTYKDDVPKLKAAIQNAVSKKENLNITYRIYTKGGQPRWVYLNAAYSPGPQGECLYQAVFTDVDKLKRLEQELQENQLRYEAAIKSSGINIWEYDIQRDSLYIVSNSSRIKQNCYCIENYIQSTLENGYVRDDSVALFLSIFERLRQGEHQITEDIWYKTTDAAGWWCERVTYTSIFDSAGAPCKAFGAGRDVTREKEAEKKFHDEMSYRKAIQSDNLASVMIDLTDNLVLEIDSGFACVMNLANKTADHYFTLTEQALAGEEYRAQYHKLFTKQKLLNCFGGGEYVLSMELPRLYDTSKIYWVNYSAHLVRNPETQHIVAHISVVDITTEKVMQTIMETIATSDYDTFVVVDGTYDSALDYGVEAKQHRYHEHESYEEQIEAQIRDCVCTEDVERVVSECKIDNIWAQIKDGDTYKFSFGMRMPDGEVRRKQLQFTAISKPRKTFLMSRVDVNNIYEEQQATKNMLEAALIAAEQANSAKSDFLSRMSHEIRTPMNAIIGMAAIAAQSIGDDEQINDCISKIAISSHFLLSLINDILDMSRIESGKMLLKSEEILFEEFMNGVNSICYTQAQAKNIDYENMIDSGVEDCYIGDAMKLQQVIINILSNAIKFTPEGGRVALKVRQIKKMKNHAVLRFSINDTGCGISQEFIPHLFEAFAQEHSGTTSIYGGTGLGLSICKHLVNMMDGSIAVRSIVGEGSEFTVEVKLGITEESKIRYLKKQSDSFDELKADFDFDGKRVLLAEDHQLNVEVAKKLLEGRGFAVEHAENGLRAMEMFRNSPVGYYDAILMDIRMPEMDGLQAAYNIRRSSREDAKTIPVIAMTANAFEDDMEKSKQAGMNAHLAKPIEPKQLFQTLFDFIYGNKGGAAARDDW